MKNKERMNNHIVLEPSYIIYLETGSECSGSECLLKYERKTAESSMNVFHVSQRLKTSNTVRTVYKKYKHLQIYL